MTQREAERVAEEYLGMVDLLDAAGDPTPGMAALVLFPIPVPEQGGLNNADLPPAAFLCAGSELEVQARKILAVGVLAHILRVEGERNG